MRSILPGPIAIEIAEKFERVIEVGAFKKIDLALAIQQGINKATEHYSDRVELIKEEMNTQVKHMPRCSCYGDPFEIHFCPMHAAAPEMLEALKEAHNALLGKSAYNSKKIEEAIAKAEGK